MSSTIGESPAKSPRASQLRTRQKELTKELIMEALVEILDRDRRYEFSMQDVADLAGISHRCLYDHFPNRGVLLDEFSAWVSDKVSERWLSGLPSSGDELPSWTREKFARITRQPALTRAATAARLSRNIRPPSARMIDGKFTEIVRGVAPDLDQGDVHRAVAVVRHLSSGQTWLVFTEQLGLSGSEAGEAASWAIGVLTEDLRKRNAVLSSGDKRSIESKIG